MKKFTLITVILSLVISAAFSQASRTVGSRIPAKAHNLNQSSLRDDFFYIPLSYVSVDNGGLGCALFIYGITDQPGYVAGNNVYGDKEKAQFFDLSTLGITSGQIDTVWVLYFIKTTNTNPEDVFVKIYGGNSEDGPNSSPLATSEGVNLDDVDTSGFFTPYVFPNKPFVSEGFFASAVLPAVEGDTLAISLTATEDGDPCYEFPGFSWEKWSDNSWHPMDSAWVGLESDLGIAALVTFNVGINDPGAAKLLVASPNPAPDYFNAAFRMYRTENVTLNVYNMTGELVKTFPLGNQPAGVHVEKLDISDLAPGLYTYGLETPTSKQYAKINVIR